MPELEEVGVNISATNVTVTTTTETVAISSGAVRVPRATVTALVFAWAQITTGVATTSVTPRIRRGTTTSGTLVGEANAEQVKAVAGSTEPLFMMASEQRVDQESVEYSLTLAQAAATGDGTVVQAGIVVLIIGG